MAFTLDDIIRRTRSRLDDMLVPYLWSDAELTDIINDTVADAVIRANLLVQDDFPIVFTQKADLTWNAKYALPSTLLSVEAVRMTSRPNVILQRTSMRKQERYFRQRPTATGTPYAFALDETILGTGDDYGNRPRAITFFGTPSVADTALLDIRRLPTRMQVCDDSVEIDDIWIPDLIYGITALAYLKRDTDTFDPKKSERDFQMFEDRFGVRLSANVMRERQTEVPIPMMLY